MCVQEFYILYDQRRERDPSIDYAGGLTDRDCAKLYDMLE